jgi:thioredoxin 1
LRHVLVPKNHDVSVSRHPGDRNDKERSENRCLRLARRVDWRLDIDVPLFAAKDGLAGRAGTSVRHYTLYDDPYQLVWIDYDSVFGFNRISLDFCLAFQVVASIKKGVTLRRGKGGSAMKKVVIFGGLIILLFVALFVISEMGNKQDIADNPYGKSRLHHATVNQLDDPNYQNQILPDELKARLDNGENIVVYFYSPECEYCREATPLIVDTSSQLDVEVHLFNLLEFQEGWKDYDIQATPTLVYFKEGVQEYGIVGLAEQEDYERFFGLIE